MTTVAVTGATGIFGRALCARLEDEPAVTRVIGLARRPFDPGVHGLAKMVFWPADVLDHDTLTIAFEGVDVVCHLAFVVMDRGADRELVRRINVEGSRNVFDAAAAAGVRRIVYASSVAAYGAHPDNPLPIHEDHPTRGNADFYYAEHKAAVEDVLDDVAAAHPEITITRIRPCVVVGPNSMDLMRGPVPAPLVGLALSRFLPWVLPDPGAAPVQFVHEDDVAEVFRLAILAGTVERAYNLAGAGTLTLAEIAREFGAVRVAVPPEVTRLGVGLASRLGLVPTGPEWLRMLEHPLVVDTTRARTQLGWIPRYDTRTALRDMLDRFRASVPLSPFKAR